MIITIDVGNTNITVGVFNGDEIVASFRMTSKMPRTSVSPQRRNTTQTPWVQPAE